MGLAVSVGTLADFLENDPEGAEWFEGDFEIVNGVLASAGLPPHIEPRELPRLDSRASLDGFPYSFIHYLRRAYAHSVVTPGWKAMPVEGDFDPRKTPSSRRRSTRPKATSSATRTPRASTYRSSSTTCCSPTPTPKTKR